MLLPLKKLFVFIAISFFMPALVHADTLLIKPSKEYVILEKAIRESDLRAFSIAIKNYHLTPSERKELLKIAWALVAARTYALTYFNLASILVGTPVVYGSMLVGGLFLYGGYTLNRTSNSLCSKITGKSVMGIGVISAVLGAVTAARCLYVVETCQRLLDNAQEIYNLLDDEAEENPIQ